MNFWAIYGLAFLLAQTPQAQEKAAKDTAPKLAERTVLKGTPKTKTPRPQKEEAVFEWVDTFATPNPIFLALDQIPVFHAELTLPADVVELRVYTTTLNLQFSGECARVSGKKAGAYVYEYKWEGARSLGKGVYFYLLRATKKGYPVLKVMKHIKIVQE